MDMLTQVSCQLQGNTWIQVGDYSACVTTDRLVLVLTAIITAIVLLFIMWLYASVRCMWLEYSRNVAYRHMNDMLRDKRMAMAQETK